jgi:hypothetical protein
MLLLAFEGFVVRHLDHFLSAGELESDISQITSPTNKLIVSSEYEFFWPFDTRISSFPSVNVLQLQIVSKC